MSSEKKKSKKSLAERLLERRPGLNKKGTGKMLYFKEGTKRIRVANAGEETDWAIEVAYIYINPEVGGLISPSTFGLPCAFDEAYRKMSKSKKEKDRAFAETIKPKAKWIVPCYGYKDQKGLEPDEERGLMFGLVTAGTYGEMIDYYTDEEYGDFTDPRKGFDLKIKRSGSGKMDTKYSVQPCKPTKVSVAEWRKVINPEEELKKTLKTYEETAEMLAKYLNLAPESEEDERPRNRKDRNKKKSRNRDI